MRSISTGGALRAIGVLLVAVIAAAGIARPAAAPAAGDRIPAFEFDPAWPKTPLPNNWILGAIGGVHVDDKDNIWVLHRGNTVAFDLGDDFLAKGVGDCCTPAPAVVVFDQAGAIVKAWGGPDPK